MIERVRLASGWVAFPVVDPHGREAHALRKHPRLEIITRGGSLFCRWKPTYRLREMSGTGLDQELVRILRGRGSTGLAEGELIAEGGDAIRAVHGLANLITLRCPHTGELRFQLQPRLCPKETHSEPDPALPPGKSPF